VPRNDLDYLRVTVKKNGMDALKQPFNGYLVTSNVQYAAGNCCDYKIRQELGRTFLSHEKRTNTPQLDTILQTKVLANSPFKISCDVFFKGNNNASTKTFNFTQLSPQDSVFVIQF
jgi:hypothetical protein